MSVLPYQAIKKLCEAGVVHNWVDFHNDGLSGLSGGIGPASYDVRLDGDVTIPPGEMVIMGTIEDLNMPLDLCADVMDKSTGARLGVSGFNTFVQPGFRGNLTVELINLGRREISLSHGMPILQLKFQKLIESTEYPYPDDARYQNQVRGGVEAILKR